MILLEIAVTTPTPTKLMLYNFIGYAVDVCMHLTHPKPGLPTLKRATVIGLLKIDLLNFDLLPYANETSNFENNNRPVKYWAYFLVLTAYSTFMKDLFNFLIS